MLMALLRRSVGSSCSLAERGLEGLIGRDGVRHLSVGISDAVLAKKNQMPRGSSAIGSLGSAVALKSCGISNYRCGIAQESSRWFSNAVKRFNPAGEGIPGTTAFTVRDLGKRVPGRVLLENINFNVFLNAKIGVVGCNGAGKSTLLKIIAGIDTNYDGEVKIAPGLVVGYLPQEPQLDPEKTVRENVLDGVQGKLALFDAYQEACDELAKDPENEELIKKKTQLEKQVVEKRLRNFRVRIDRAMNALRCPPPDADVVDLSGGERRRVALCKLLVNQPDILILDEPTNHLDAETISWLENHLNDYEGVVISVTHDRYFLDNIAAYILEIDRGSAIPYRGNYTGWLEAKRARLEKEEKQETARIKMLKEEWEWLHSAKKKNKTRIAKYEELAEQTSKLKPRPGTIVIPPGPRLGKVVLRARNISKSIDGRILFEKLSFDIPPGAIVGIVGPNGSGKTTLFNIISGDEDPDEGEIELGQTVEIGYAEQFRDELDPHKTIYEELASEGPEIDLGHATVHVRQYLASFNFKGAAQEKRVGSLSGGERNRLHIAKMLKGAPNFILLDEPTNDLDVDVLRSLEDALDKFAGCAMIISHDRYFLDRVCTHIISFEGNSKVNFFPGNYSEYEADRIRRYGRMDPTRIKYRKLI